MLWATITTLNTSKLFVGIVMIILNLGSKYISVDISKTQEAFLSNKFIRRLIVFTIVFTATRDIVISIIITLAFIVVMSGLLNEESKICIIPKVFHISKDQNITQEDVEQAKKILEYADKNGINNDKNIQYKKTLDIKNQKISKFKVNTKKIRDSNNISNTLLGILNL
jgi:hypothetical protein